MAEAAAISSGDVIKAGSPATPTKQQSNNKGGRKRTAADVAKAAAAAAVLTKIKAPPLSMYKDKVASEFINVLTQIASKYDLNTAWTVYQQFCAATDVLLFVRTLYRKLKVAAAGDVYSPARLTKMPATSAKYNIPIGDYQADVAEKLPVIIERVYKIDPDAAWRIRSCVLDMSCLTT